MTIITIDGNLGSGGRDIGIELAKQLKFDYLDRWILTIIAQKLGATVDVLSEKELQSGDLNQKISRILNQLLQKSALVGIAGDPSFGPGIDQILSKSYDAPSTPITDVNQIDDEKFIEVTKQVVSDFAGMGNSIIVGRGGCFILKNRPNAIHFSTVAEIDDRISRIQVKHNLNYNEALKFINESDKGREGIKE